MRESPPVCDYEGSDYRERFWEGQAREYEDQAERIALRRLIPPTGDTLIDIGAGYGRLADEYGGYKRVVLFDYSRSLLREAQENLGNDPRYIFVAGDWYRMPFVSGLFDTMVQVRTIHHAADVPRLFEQLARIARPQGHFILEFANKHNLKAMIRYLARRQEWSPFTTKPVEFVELNIDFHPNWMKAELERASFSPSRTLSVSQFRIPLLKSLVPTPVLVGLDKLYQGTGRWWQLSPSVFVESSHPEDGVTADKESFFACPTCQSPLGNPEDELLRCPNPECGPNWRVIDGLYDFKEPVIAREAASE